MGVTPVYLTGIKCSPMIRNTDLVSPQGTYLTSWNVLSMNYNHYHKDKLIIIIIIMWFVHDIECNCDVHIYRTDLLGHKVLSLSVDCCLLISE